MSPLATWGMRPVIAGVKKAVPAPTSASAARKPHSGGWPIRIQAASAPWAAPRRRSEESMTRRRLKRSAMTPPMRRNRTIGATSTPSTSPTWVVEPPRCKMAKDNATGNMPVPIQEVRRPMK